MPPAEVDALGDAEVHGRRYRGDIFDQSAQYMRLGRDQLVSPQQVEVVPHSVDVSFAEPVCDHLIAILLPHVSPRALRIQKGVGPESLLAFQARLLNIEIPATHS